MIWALMFVFGDYLLDTFDIGITKFIFLVFWPINRFKVSASNKNKYVRANAFQFKHDYFESKAKRSWLLQKKLNNCRSRRKIFKTLKCTNLYFKLLYCLHNNFKNKNNTNPKAWTGQISFYKPVMCAHLTKWSWLFTFDSRRQPFTARRGFVGRPPI